MKLSGAASWLALVVIGTTCAVPACGGTMPSSDPTLAAIANRKTLKLTTIGRKTGKHRTAEIWFVVEGDHLFVQAGKKARRGWLANLRSDPEVDLDIAGTRLHGRASIIADPAEAKRVLALFRQKYWLARVAGWIGAGIGAGVPVRIDGDWANHGA